MQHPSLPLTNYDRRLLALLFAGVMMAALDIAIVGPALPAIREGFGIDERAAAWVIGIYVLANLIGTPVMAKLSDALGRREVYVADVVLFAAGSVIVAAAPTFEVLLAGRAIQGLGAGGIFPVASAVIGDVFPPERRGAALGLIGAVFGLAFVIGPVLGGVLLLFGWPWLFLVNLPLAAAVVAGAVRLLPGRDGAERQHLDVPGMLLLSVILLGVSIGLNRIGGDAGAHEWAVPLAIALALVPVFVFTEQRTPDPVIRLKLFRSRPVLLVSVISLAAGLSEAGVSFAPALLVSVFAVTPSTGSFMLLPIVAAMAVGAPLAGRLVDLRGSRTVVIAGVVSLAIGLGGVALFTTRLGPLLVAGMLIGVGFACLRGSALRYIMLHEVPSAQRAAGQALLIIFTSTGRLAGVALVGALIVAGGSGAAGYGRAFLVLACITGLLGASALGLRSRDEEQRVLRGAEPPTLADPVGAVARPFEG